MARRIRALEAAAAIYQIRLQDLENEMDTILSNLDREERE